MTDQTTLALGDHQDGSEWEPQINTQIPVFWKTMTRGECPASDAAAILQAQQQPRSGSVQEEKWRTHPSSCTGGEMRPPKGERKNVHLLRPGLVTRV